MKGKTKPKYKRVLLKLSGEALGGDSGFGICPETVHDMARQISEVRELGVQVVIVVGGGNIFRGLQGSEEGIDRTTGDYMGMMATIINACALRDILENLGVQTRVQSALWMQEIAEPFIRLRAIRHLEKGRVVLFAAGTGNPYFTTDTAAALRAMEMRADIIMKATKVDGIFSADPMTDPTATRIDSLTHIEVLERRLNVMDATAISLCMDNKLPIVIFNLTKPGNVRRAVLGEPIGSMITV